MIIPSVLVKNYGRHSIFHPFNAIIFCSSISLNPTMMFIFMLRMTAAFSP
jgi:hypothetical protein